jgi:hypothetical protein
VHLGRKSLRLALQTVQYRAVLQRTDSASFSIITIANFRQAHGVRCGSKRLVAHGGDVPGQSGG